MKYLVITNPGNGWERTKEDPMTKVQAEKLAKKYRDEFGVLAEVIAYKEGGQSG